MMEISSLALLSGDTGTAGALDTIMGLVPKAFNFVGTIITSVVSIDLFGMLLALSLVGVGLGLFARMRNSVT